MYASNKQQSWYNMVTNIDPATGYYFGATDILLESNTAYEFQILSFEGDIETANYPDDIVTLEPTASGMSMI